MDRRIKDRLPPVVLANLLRIPQLVLIVSATICLTPEALARVQDEQVEATFVLHSVKTANEWKTYTKEELRQAMPSNPVVSIADRVRTEIGQLLRRVTSLQRAPLRDLAVPEVEERNVKFALATLREMPKRGKANTDAIRTVLSTDIQRVLSQQTQAKLDIINKINGGYSFNLDLDDMFSSGEASSAASGQVRYGLILEDIQPTGAPGRAAIADIASELEFAGHADVKWTIGPIDEEQGRRLFHVSAPNQKDPTGLKKYLPKPGVKGKLRPENLENISSKDSTNPAGWRIDLSQEQGYYTLTYRTELAGKKISEEHQVTVPIIGDMRLGRRFDDKWDVVQTSAYNILIDKRLPILSVHHLNVEQRYRADLAYRIDGHTVGISGRGKAEGVVTDEANRPEAYSLTYSKRF